MEVWKPVVGYEGKFEVSNLGRVKRLAHGRRHWCGRMIPQPERIVTQSKHSGGYLLVNLGNTRKEYAHRVVMAAFTGPANGQDVNHIDGDKSNNALSNLEYCDRLYNVHHAIATGLQNNAGEGNGMHKYDEQQIKYAASLVKNGCTQKEASLLSGVSIGMVQQVVKGKRWKHLGLAVAALLLMIGTLPAQVLLVSPHHVADAGKMIAKPTLAPVDCPCTNCRCNPCLCLIKPEPPVVSVKKTYTPAEASVLVRVGKGNEAYQCSGTAICDHTVLTCWHILRERDFLSVTVNGKPAKVLRFDPKADLALITTDEQLKPVDVAKAAPQLREPVTALGFEFDKAGKLWYWNTWITATNRYSGFSNQSIAGKPLSGRSGGGLFNAAGELVGVCSAADGQEGLYAGLPAIRKLVYGETKIDPSKYVAPDFLKTPDFLSGKTCPNGKCPLQNKAPSKSLPAVVSNPAGVSLGSPGSCSNGSCGRPAVRVFGSGR